jgi:glutaredoxin
VRFLQILLLLAVFPLAHAGTIYRSVTPDGTVIYSDVPQAAARITKTYSFDTPTVIRPGSPIPEAEATIRYVLPRAVAGRNERGQTVLFTSKTCGQCAAAKAHLLAKQVPFYEFDVDTAHGYRSLAVAGGGTNVPVLLARNQKIQGYSRHSYDALFGRAAATPADVRPATDETVGRAPARVVVAGR